jgi:hypothetical protein
LLCPALIEIKSKQLAGIHRALGLAAGHR